jgi:hypothetical protein
MRRRELIPFLGGAVVLPLAAAAQPDRARRVGIIVVTAKTAEYVAATGYGTHLDGALTAVPSWLR